METFLVYLTPAPKFGVNCFGIREFFIKSATSLVSAIEVYIIIISESYAESSLGVGYSVYSLSPFILTTQSPALSSQASGKSTQDSKDESDWKYDKDDRFDDQSVDCESKTEDGETKIVCGNACDLVKKHFDKDAFEFCNECLSGMSGYACRTLAWRYSEKIIM